MTDALHTIPDESLYFIDKNPYATCAICMELVKEKNKSILVCGHEFHAHCLMENAINSNNTCPLCREVVTVKAVEVPELKINLISKFVETALTKKCETDMRSNMKEMLKRCGISWKDLKNDAKVGVLYHMMQMMIDIGIDTGKYIQKWIDDGNDRFMMDEESDYNIHVNLNTWLNEPDDEEVEEYERTSLIPLFHTENIDPHVQIEYREEEVVEDGEIIEDELEYEYEVFIRNYGIQKYRNRIIESDYLCVFDHLLKADIENIMYPDSYRNRPLFSRQEAEEIMGCIIMYFSQFHEMAYL